MNAGERGILKGQFPSGAMAIAEEGNSNTETVRSSKPCNIPTQVIDGTLDSDSIIRMTCKPSRTSLSILQTQFVKEEQLKSN